MKKQSSKLSESNIPYRVMLPYTDKQKEVEFGVKIEYLTKEEIMKKYGNECYQDEEVKKEVDIEAHQGGYWVDTKDGSFSIEHISDLAPLKLTLDFVVRLFRDANYDVNIKS